MSSDRSQISALPPQEYGDRFIKFMAGVTMSPEEAERDELDRQAAAEATAHAETEGESISPGNLPHANSAPATAPSYLPPAPPELRSPRSPQPNPTVEKATMMAMKEKDMAKEQDVPDRRITTAAAGASNGVGRGNSSAVLPVVEETAEAASLSGRSRDGNRPYTPNQMENPGVVRADGFTDLGPHGIGGRGPPTPPKSSYLIPAAGYEGNRPRRGSGGSASIASIPKGRLSRESLEKALPPLPGR